MKKYIIGGVLVVAFVAYYIFASNFNNNQVALTPTSTTPTPGGATGNSSGVETLNPGAGTPSGSDTGTGNNTSTSGSTGTGTGAGTGTGTGSGSTSGSGSTATTGQYKDGTYTGSLADAFYGNLQVKATISGGKLTDVTFLQYPQGGESSMVSRMALPQLRSEAIAAQSANVNIVSGATQDSQAFQQTLGSALAQAKV